MIVIVGVYLELVDVIGHYSGPNSTQLQQTIVEIDQRLGVLLDLIQHDDDQIDVMLFSDHGMAERVGGQLDPVTSLINIGHYNITHDDYERVLSSGCPILQIWPKEGRLDSVCSRLRLLHYLYVNLGQ